MKKFFSTTMRRCFLALFFTATLGLAEAWAQAIVVEPVYGSGTVDIDASTGTNNACLNYTTQSTNTGEEKDYTITSITGVSGPFTYSWSIKGGAVIVGSTTGSTVTVKPTIVDNRFNKARLFLTYTATKTVMVPDDCTNPPGPDKPVTIGTEGQVYVDLYQHFTYTDPIVGEECIDPSIDYAFSIRDMVSGNADNIGIDSYVWDLTDIEDLLPSIPNQRLYTSGDESAIALDFTTGLTESRQITVIPGRCNSTTIIHTLKAIMPTPTYEIEDYDNCIPAAIKQITINNTDLKSDVTYTWELANSNFTFATPATEASATINIGPYAGIIYLKASPDPLSDFCSGTNTGEVVVAIEIKRSLDGSVTISGPECVDPSGEDPEYTLNPNPGTKVSWVFPDDYWTIDNPDNENASTVAVTVDDALAGPGIITVATLGCLEQTISLDVNFPPGTVGDINEGTSTICMDYGDDDAIVLEIDPVANADGYFWKLPEGWAFQSGDELTNDGPSTTVIPDGLHSGAVEVYAKGKGECAKSNTSTRTFAFNAVKPTAVTASSCINSGKAGQVTFSVTNPVAGQTYNWVEPAFSGWTIDSYEDVGSSVNAKVIMNTDGVNGSYVVQVRGTNTCFTTTYYNHNTSISAAVAEMAVINGFGNDQFAIFQESTPPRVNMPGGTTYQWYSNGNAISGAVNFNLLLDNYVPNSTVGVDVKLLGNNCVTYLETTSDYAASLRKGPNEEEYLLLPNPANTELKVKINRSFSTASFKLKDASGKSVKQVDKASQETAISTVDIPNGIYLIEINIDGETQVKKVQVLH
ncbi:MAG: large protein [Cytophagaceae bacterium]|jgi:hypothetical protein|nr:large protein [Cytophagaceae bacterium]